MKTPLYEIQKKLSKRRLNAIKKGHIGVIDIGTAKVACLILRFIPQEKIKNRPSEIFDPIKSTPFRVIGVATTRSRGVTCGKIESIMEVEKAIRTVVQGAQKMAGLLLEDVLISFSGGDPKSYGVFGSTLVEKKNVSETDIGNALLKCEIPDFGARREVVHALPVNFSLDDKTGLIDPRGQMGKNLEVDLHLMTIEEDLIHDIINVANRCLLTLSGLIFAPYVSGISSLTEDEHQLGAACIDMGAGTSGVTIFLKKQMIYAGSIKLGGIQITNDIMKAFKISFRSAERIKNLHGGAISTGRDDRDLIDIERGFDVNFDDRITISRSELIGVIRPRIEEILEEVKEHLDVAGFRYLQGQRIVLTGGASQLPGLFDIALSIFGSSIRIGKPIRVQGLPHATNGPEFASAIGLALHSASPQDECWDFNISFSKSRLASTNRLFKWFSENW